MPMTSPDPAPAPEPHLRGLSLARLAGVDAGLAERLPIERVLENEGVSPPTWRAAEAAWRARLAEDVDEEGPLSAAYDARLAAAQDRYGRSLPPVDGDLAAWLDLVRCFAGSAEPLALLRELGLRPTDLVRLHRRWSLALEADGALRERALALLEADPGLELGAMPELYVGATAVVPPPPEGPAEQVTAPVDDDLDDEEDEDEDEDEEDEDEDGVEEEPPPLWVPLPDWPREMPTGERAPDLAAVPPAPRPLARPSFARVPEPPAPPAAVAAPPLSASATVAGAFLSPFHTPLPFQKTPAVTAEAPEDAPEQGVVIQSAQASPLPFRTAAPDATTAGASISPFHAQLPFRPEASAPVAAPPARPAPARTVMTSASPDLRSASALPFRSPVAIAAPPPQPALGATAPPDAMSPFAVAPTPFQGRLPPPARPPARPAVAAPIDPSPAPPAAPVVAEAPPMPALTLDQYASLCAELTVFPQQTEAVFEKYGLGPLRARLAVDLGWRERLRRAPDEYAAWQALYARYHVYWTEQTRGGGHR